MKSIYEVGYRKKRRKREIDVEVVERMRCEMKLTKTELAEMMNISSSQLSKYYKCGYACAARYYAARDAILVALEQEYSEKRNKIMNIFSNDSE